MNVPARQPIMVAVAFGLAEGMSGITDASATRRFRVPWTRSDGSTTLSGPTRPDFSRTFGELVDHWLEMSYALNQVNRSMGRDDLYPFVLAPTVVRKLAFVDQMVRRHSLAAQVSS